MLFGAAYKSHLVCFYKTLHIYGGHINPDAVSVINKYESLIHLESSQFIRVQRRYLTPLVLSLKFFVF